MKRTGIQHGLTAGNCLYVGDAERNIEAARNADMPCVIAQYGYLDETDAPDTWGALGLVSAPEEILNYL